MSRIDIQFAYVGAFQAYKYYYESVDKLDHNNLN
jgi:hypothetical protein